MAALSVGGLMVVSLGAVGAWFFLGLGQGQEEWRAEYEGPPSDTQNHAATWFTEKHVVRGQLKDITAYSPADGAEQWKLPVPEKGALICASSPVTGDGVAVLAYGKPGDCDNVFAVDLAKGKKLWEQPVEGSEEEPPLAVSGDIVVVGDKTAYRLRDGSEAWQSQKFTEGSGKCTDGSYTGGKNLVRTQACQVETDEFGDPAKGTYSVAGIDARTGAPEWVYKAQSPDELGEPYDGDVLSTSPLLVRDGDKYRVLSDQGKPRGLVRVDGYDNMGQSEAVRSGGPSPAVKASGDTLLIEHQPRGEDYERVDAFSMASGKRLWGTKPSPEVSYDLVQGEDERLLAKKKEVDLASVEPQDSEEPGGSPFSVVTFDPGTGEESEVQDYAGVGDALGDYMVPYLREDQLFLSSVSDRGSAGSDISGDYHSDSMIVLES